jgi:hypothetical protein
LKTTELLREYIYPNLNVESLLKEIFVKERGGAYILECPSCGKKEAYILKKQNTIIPFIRCNRLNKCAYSVSLWDYIKYRGGLSNKETLEILATYANIDIRDFSYTKSAFNSSYRDKPKKQKVKDEEKYNELKDTDRYYKMDLLIKDFINLPEKLQFCTIVTFIYNFSLIKNQSQKIAYYQKRCILQTKELGSLNIWDIKELERELLKNFDLQLLQKFNIFKEKKFKYGFSSFSVVPSFDLYSNLLAAIRLRNLKKSKIKEIEVSATRIANPLPFGVTKEKLLKYNTFYFTEGHIDALSLNLENFVAVEGVNSFDKKNLGYFKSKNIIIIFDQDKAGEEGAKKLYTQAKKIGINCFIVTWDSVYGNDINEMLIVNNMHLLSRVFYDLKSYGFK